MNEIHQCVWVLYTAGVVVGEKCDMAVVVLRCKENKHKVPLMNKCVAIMFLCF